MNLKEALELSIEAEKNAMERYTNLAKEVEDPETRLMLEQIAREEAGHLKKLKERLKAVTLLD
ncbi:MAG TPA: ferritin family protein [Syntrophomonadaceae bacterium]|jgi:rubrerythrin|nr:ferritin family protein [Syntrophomonas sp.]HRY12610.1 ferritin family protein [Syntrophomonadaceae bacterium]